MASLKPDGSHFWADPLGTGYAEICGYWRGRTKSGAVHKRDSYFVVNDITWLNECDLCGKISTPKRVTHRNFAWITYKTFEIYDASCLCTSCWNKYRALEKRLLDAEHIAKVARKLKSVSYKVGENHA